MPPKFARIPDSSDLRSAHDVERQGLLDGDDSDEDFFLRGDKRLVEQHHYALQVQLSTARGPSVRTNNLRSDPKISRLQNQVDDVVDVMKNNVSKVLDRGERLDDLQDKSDSLASNSDMFRSRAKGLQRSMWWKNCRMKIILAIVVVVVLAIIIIPIIIKSQQ